MKSPIPTGRELLFGLCLIIGIVLACTDSFVWSTYLISKIFAALFILAALLLLPWEEPSQGDSDD